MLTDKEERSLPFYEKGYLGECLYDKIFEEVGHSNLYLFRDTWLEINSSIVQLDSLIISDGEMIINEIFNFSGGLMSKGYIQRKLSLYCEINSQEHAAHYILNSVYIEDIIKENMGEARYKSDIKLRG